MLGHSTEANPISINIIISGETYPMRSYRSYHMPIIHPLCQNTAMKATHSYPILSHSSGLFPHDCSMIQYAPSLPYVGEIPYFLVMHIPLYIFLTCYIQWVLGKITKSYYWLHHSIINQLFNKYDAITEPLSWICLWNPRKNKKGTP